MLQRTAGFVIIIGVVLWLAAAFTSPPGVYSTSDISARLGILDTYSGRWTASQVLFGLGAVVPAVGLALLALHLRGDQGGWLPMAVGAAFVVGGLLGALVVYRQTADPASFWEGTQPALPGLVYAWLTVIALGVLGFLFVQGSFPNWIGYASIGLAGVGAIALIATGMQAGFYIVSIVYLVSLVIGIIAL